MEIVLSPESERAMFRRELLQKCIMSLEEQEKFLEGSVYYEFIDPYYHDSVTITRKNGVTLVMEMSIPKDMPQGMRYSVLAPHDVEKG